MSQNIGLVASWNEFRKEDAARLHLRYQFLNRLLKRANGARAICENRVAGESAEGKDQSVRMLKINEGLIHVSGFARLHQVRADLILDPDCIVSSRFGWSSKQFRKCMSALALGQRIE